MAISFVQAQRKYKNLGIVDFLDSHERGYSEREQFYWWLGRAKRLRIRKVKYRTAFAHRHNRAI